MTFEMRTGIETRLVSYTSPGSQASISHVRKRNDLLSSLALRGCHVILTCLSDYGLLKMYEYTCLESRGLD